MPCRQAAELRRLDQSGAKGGESGTEPARTRVRDRTRSRLSSMGIRIQEVCRSQPTLSNYQLDSKFEDHKTLVKRESDKFMVNTFLEPSLLVRTFREPLHVASRWLVPEEPVACSFNQSWSA